MKKLRLEPVLWMLFSGGGVLAAMLIPVLLLFFGVLFPLGLTPPPDYARLLHLMSNPITRLALLALCVMSLFHFAHRFRYTVVDGLKVKQLDFLITPVCYLAAIAGSAVSAYWILQIP